MSTKTISITNEAYERLSTFKGINESFSDVINKLTKKNSILNIVGLLSNKEAKELKDWHKKINEDIENAMEKTAKRLQ